LAIISKNNDHNIGPRLSDEARTYYRLFVGDCLAAVALISTVSNLRGIWMMLISLIPVGKDHRNISSVSMENYPTHRNIGYIKGYFVIIIFFKWGDMVGN
jgi:hypothetical protein